MYTLSLKISLKNIHISEIICPLQNFSEFNSFDENVLSFLLPLAKKRDRKSSKKESTLKV